jgi:tRNA dimethylallyltransferase
MQVVVICGPTATGKTALAAALAHRLGTEVISADSRQVYRGLDLGTGKDLGEFRGFDPPVPYHLIDIAEPEEIYTLFQYQDACYRVLESLTGRLDKVVMAGGTGLYIEAVLRRYRIANVPEDAAFRAGLESRDHGDLTEQLRRRDPELASRTDLASKKRVIRALEIAEAGRNGPVEYSRLPEANFSYTVFATAWDRAELRRRIDERLDQRLAAGMVGEVEGLLKQGVKPERLRLLGMEYREITDFLQGAKEYATMVEDLRHEIHLLAKRQETYFRGMEKRGVPVRWIKKEEGLEAMLESLGNG